MPPEEHLATPESGQKWQRGFWALVYVLNLLPDTMLRLLLWLATHTLYRLDIAGRERVPAKGGALLVPNHVSMADAAFLIASLDRPVRFLMFKGSYDHPLVKPFAKILGVIPIASDQGPREMIHSLREATEALRKGELVCIFPEGQMTRIGQMLPFRRGMERIMKGVDVPIIPVNLDGVWGSIFSFAGGRFLWKFPRHLPYPVGVTFGEPLPPTATSTEARRAVQDLSAEAFARRKRRMKTLQRSFLHTVRRHPFRFAMADGQTPGLSFFAALARTLFLARRLRTHWRGQQMVGILLPPSIPGALVNLAAMLMGKVPVNLNYTASNETLASCAQQCNLKTIVSARAFLERVRVQPPVDTILLEDLAKNPKLSERLAAALAAACFPTRAVEKFAGSERSATLDDLATIIFSSGSTGEPKGVMLTHYNVASNVEQLSQVFFLRSDDRIMGILPFFHSFGFTGTLCLPAAAGIGVVFHPNPLDARVIGALVNKYAVTLLLATPTFLNAYVRRCTPEEFGSLRFVLAGAEKLPDRISIAFEDHFGIRPLEGYGCTECSPVVAVNTIDFRATSFRQVGAKRGSIGHPLPGITIKIVDPETHQVLGDRHAGIAAGARPERHAGLSEPSGQDRRRSARRLVQHRRHRHRRRRRLPAHHRPPQPLQQNRRRNGAAHQGRGKASGASRRGRASVRSHRGAGREKRRAPDGPAYPRRGAIRGVPGAVREVRSPATVASQARSVLAHRGAALSRHGQAGPAEGPRTSAGDSQECLSRSSIGIPAHDETKRLSQKPAVFSASAALLCLKSYVCRDTLLHGLQPRISCLIAATIQRMLTSTLLEVRAWLVFSGDSRSRCWPWWSSLLACTVLKRSRKAAATRR